MTRMQDSHQGWVDMKSRDPKLVPQDIRPHLVRHQFPGGPLRTAHMIGTCAVPLQLFNKSSLAMRHTSKDTTKRQFSRQPAACSSTHCHQPLIHSHMHLGVQCPREPPPPRRGRAQLGLTPRFENQWRGYNCPAMETEEDITAASGKIYKSQSTKPQVP